MKCPRCDYLMRVGTDSQVATTWVCDRCNEMLIQKKEER